MSHRVGFRTALFFSPFALAALAAAACTGNAGDAEDVEATSEAVGATYQVGPTRTYKDLASVASLVKPGDVVQVDGNATYGAVRFTNMGSASAKITLQGIRVNGKRPVLSGGSSSTIELAGDHYVMSGFEVTGGATRCIYHHADDITIQDTFVHDCPQHGILGADSDSGSLTMQYVEVTKSGSGTDKHPVYIATDETAHPGSVFLMQHCYIHDNNGGNSVKSRAERNNIYYNWIEGGLYKELELIGPDGQDESLAREDSDVVGNVFRKTHTQYVMRVGGDGTGETWGRYRVVNNTFLLMQGSAAAIQLFDGIESIEMSNNVFYRVGGGGVTIFDDEATWATGAALIAGTNNFVSSSSTTPSQWTNTKVTDSPGFVNVSSRDVHLTSSSPLVNAGATPLSVAGHLVSNTLWPPAYLPPPGVIEALGAAQARPVAGAIDVGAFEYGSSSGSSGAGGASVSSSSSSASSSSSTGSGPSSSSASSSSASSSASSSSSSGGGVACQTAAENVWTSAVLSSEASTFTATMDVTPSDNDMDSAVGLAHGAPSTWTGMAAIVRFNTSGGIDARNGSTYAATNAVSFKGGATYHVRFAVDVAHHTYSAFVTPPGGSEVQIASNFAFRTEQSSVSSLDHATVAGSDIESSTMTACNIAAK